MLVVSVDEERRVFLNNTLYGTLADTGMLRDKLAELFAERERIGAYRIVSDLSSDSARRSPTVEKTVRVEVPYTFTYGEVVGLIDAIKVAGADPIELQIDGHINSEEGIARIPNAISRR
jgi:biopolymer transport protein ExbD